MTDILLIDDDPELGEMLSSYLEKEGFSMDSTITGDSGLKAAEKKGYELILLDVMLPDMSGFNVLSSLRATSNVPVVMLTGRGEEIDRVVGLEMGADDYIPKPFPLRELLARIRAVLRRYEVGQVEGGVMAAPAPKKNIEFGTVVINRSARHLTLDEKTVHLTSTEFDLMEQLAMNMGNVVERNDLMERALGRGMDFDDYVLNVHMSNLRKKLGANVSIKTIRGRGYLLATPSGGAA
ncbi:response regulator transcription factor [Pseudodesulfovibrio sp. zrk46]|uniref:response regulator transcription factor n=1 Tax=Pseudodesulfovibrio sp. zrk46 TaxID=2725288 RepID=UPI00144A07E4|nr:response regulator transcription factor [Pseudodesulfovibrio sp. zrk46]QJB57228.1 response regulator transcription factor [Pseudodesulfovibrio sp. zrk46]